MPLIEMFCQFYLKTLTFQKYKVKLSLWILPTLRYQSKNYLTPSIVLAKICDLQALQH